MTPDYLDAFNGQVSVASAGKWESPFVDGLNAAVALSAAWSDSFEALCRKLCAEEEFILTPSERELVLRYRELGGSSRYRK